VPAVDTGVVVGVLVVGFVDVVVLVVVAFVDVVEAFGVVLVVDVDLGMTTVVVGGGDDPPPQVNTGGPGIV